MAHKDYYRVLGVPRTESLSGIRAAYRDLAKRHHPDVAGDIGRERFLEISEAYEVLSDPDRRRLYNHSLEVGGSEFRPAEPPVPASRVRIFEDAGSIHPSYEELLGRWARNFTGIGVPKAERAEGLNIELELTSEEALRGSAISLEVPVYGACGWCRGSGRDWLFPCLACHGEGIVERREVVSLGIPPAVAHGTVIELPLRGLGVHNFYLRVHVFISDE